MEATIFLGLTDSGQIKFKELSINNTLSLIDRTKEPRIKRPLIEVVAENSRELSINGTMILIDRFGPQKEQLIEKFPIVVYPTTDISPISSWPAENVGGRRTEQKDE